MLGWQTGTRTLGKSTSLQWQLQTFHPAGCAVKASGRSESVV